MFPPSSFRDSTHETSVLIFEDSQQKSIQFFLILEDKHISKHHFETRGIYRFNLPVRKRKVGCQLFITTRAISCEGAGKSCGILAQVAIKSTKISLAQSFHGDLPLKKTRFCREKMVNTLPHIIMEMENGPKAN